MIAIGFLGLAQGDFAPIWTAVPQRWPGREALALLTVLVSLAGGLGMLWGRWSSSAAGGLGVFLIGWMLAAKGPAVLAAPAAAGSWESLGETVVLASAALGVAGRRRAAHVLYGLSLIAFGWSHLAYLKTTAGLVPAWLPAHSGLSALTGVTYLAAGAAILTGRRARLAAMLAALQMGLFALLVWGPHVASGRPSADQWSEFVISWALTAAGWALADTYRARLGLRRPN
jgi:uncharacterized membrane protein YphA (DoxX/SURF4 family)